MLGIILGVSSLVAMSALVKGMENGTKEALIAIGGLEKVRIEEQDIPVWQQYLADQAVGTTMSDVHAILRSAPLVRMVVPEMRTRNITLTYGAKSISPWNFIGTWPNSVELNQHVIAHGRMFNEVDDENARNVCVIGTAIRDSLFGSPEQIGREIIPVGEFVNINSQRFKITGMFEHYERNRTRSLPLHENRTKSKAPGRNRICSGSRSASHPGWFVFDEEQHRLYPTQHDVAALSRDEHQWRRIRRLIIGRWPRGQQVRAVVAAAARSGRRQSEFVPDPRLSTSHPDRRYHTDEALQRPKRFDAHSQRD
jgi:putative ABC transport system permease protein